MPEEIVIVGGGPVGIEFATIFHALGAKVTLVDRGARLATMMDGEITTRLANIFREWGVEVKLGSTLEASDVTLSTRALDTCWSRPAALPIPRASGSRRPACASTRAAGSK